MSVGGAPMRDATAFEAVMEGAGERLPDDGALLAEIGAMLYWPYGHFQHKAQRWQ